MKRIIFLILISFTCMALLSAQTTPGTKILRHVVMFKFKDSTTPKEVTQVVDAFAQLPKKITTIKDFEWGTNNSPEKLNDGLTHCFFVSFGNEKDRDDYLVNPAHKAFVEILRPHLDKVLVLDYWATK